MTCPKPSCGGRLILSDKDSRDLVVCDTCGEARTIESMKADSEARRAKIKAGLREVRRRLGEEPTDDVTS